MTTPPTAVAPRAADPNLRHSAAPFTMTGKARVLGALQGAPIDQCPVWLMRQAGRFLPEYRAMREHIGFMDMVRSPDACTEAALQPLRRFPLDATIVFSDILVLLDALGAGVAFTRGEGPAIERPVRGAGDAAALSWEGATDRLGYVYDAVRQLRGAAPDHALFGFAGSPWTLFCYLVQGQGSNDFGLARRMVWEAPDLAREVLDKLAMLVTEHLRRQLDAGADCVQVFDTWGGLLPVDTYQRFASPGLRMIAEALAPAPVVLYVRAGGHLVAETATLGYSALSVHETVDLATVRAYGVPTQGNLDPAILAAPPAVIEAEVRRIHASLGGGHDHIYNLGHGIWPGTPPEGVGAFVNAVRGLP